MREKFFRSISVLLAICTLFSLAACSAFPSDHFAESTDSAESEQPMEPWEYVDVLDAALKLSSLSKLFNSKPQAYGVGSFFDYITLHRNPEKLASYSTEITAMAKQSSHKLSTVADFCADMMQAKGFKSSCRAEAISASEDISQAIIHLYEVCGYTNFTVNEAMQKKLEKISPDVKPFLAEYLFAIANALELNYEATEQISAADFSLLYGLSFCSPHTYDHLTLQTAFDLHTDEMEEKLLRAGWIVLQASSRLAVELEGKESLTVDNSCVSIFTPAGDVLLGDAGDTVYQNTRALLIVDPSGNDRYCGSVAASMSLKMPISVVIDLSGNDSYDAAETNAPTQGAGVFGSGVLLDLSGNDTYTAKQMAQATAMYGLGILFDADGNDAYFSHVTSQASAYYGFALLSDAAGDDTYDAYGYAQASAGNRGMAFLSDANGNDTYFVEPFVQNGYEGMDYGQFPGVSGNWSQGCGMGQRYLNTSTQQRGASGGIAGLIDLDGNDVYRGGIWVQGVGYWSGIGMLCDIGGNDRYYSKYYSQASVAHYGIGALIDIGGNDRHLLQEQKMDAGEGASLGFTWDRGVAMLVNDGGNDVYQSEQTSFGVSWSAYDDKHPLEQDQCYAFFIDTCGADRYVTNGDPSFAYGLGGFFWDMDGVDSYPVIAPDNATQTMKNGGVFFDFNAENENQIAYLPFWEEAKAVLFP